LKAFDTGDVLEKVQENNVKFIRLQFTDIFGAFKNIAIPVEELPRALEGQIMFDSTVIEGMADSKEEDIYLSPDPKTFVIFPWRPREGAVARLICDILTPSGKPFAGCSRNVLKKTLTQAKDKGFDLEVAVEIEFFLFHTDQQGKPTAYTHDQAGYCALTPVDLGENARRDMVLTLQEMGFEVLLSHHESAPGQHKIFLKEDTALNTADNIATFKFVVRTIAQRHGLHASFMPKPLNEHNGSGMYLHHILRQGEHNTFYDPAAPQQLSQIARHYTAGLISQAKALTAINNPLINSFKRLNPYYVEPVLAAWSEQNRETMLRLPAQRGDETRLILRSPDPTANPYLVLACSLVAGLDGVSRAMEPPPMLKEVKDIKLLHREIGLPGNLAEAVLALAKNDLIRANIGEYISRRFIKAKEKEWERYQYQVHLWELDEYLTAF